jgi:hypothetical protein
MFCSSMLNPDFTVIREFRSGPLALQQSLGRFLGALDYDAHPHGTLEAIQCLIDSVAQGVRMYFIS